MVRLKPFQALVNPFIVFLNTVFLFCHSGRQRKIQPPCKQMCRFFAGTQNDKFFYLLYINHNRHIPDTSIHTNARGVSTFQHKFISWSTRRRGSVHLIHICTPISSRVLIAIQKMPHAPPVVQSANRTTPIFGNGVFHAPKNSTTLIMDTRNIMEYSAKKTKANCIPVNSV